MYLNKLYLNTQKSNTVFKYRKMKLFINTIINIQKYSNTIVLELYLNTEKWNYLKWYLNTAHSDGWLAIPRP